MAGLPPRRLRNFLLERGVTEVFHANSVATSCHFIRENSLLSRGTVERLGLKQTSQYTDNADKKYSIWFDVFVDTVDIHQRASRRNQYGPVTFVIDTNIIMQQPVGQIWITKLNPTQWAGKSNKERWFQNMDELEDQFRVGTFDHMIVFRHSGGELPLGDYLDHIVLDDPELSHKNIEFYSSAYGALISSMFKPGVKTPLRRRRCRANCVCVSEYRRDKRNASRLFYPLSDD